MSASPTPSSDPNAFHEQFRRLVERLRPLIALWLAPWRLQPEDIEDIAQEVYRGLHDRLCAPGRPPVRDVDAFAHWLTEKRRIDAFRARRAWVSGRVESDVSSEDDMAFACPCSEQPDRRLLHEEAVASLRQALASLSPLHREVLYWYMLGLSHQEIARQCGIDEKRSRVVTCQAKKALRALIDNDPDTWVAFVEEHALAYTLLGQDPGFTPPTATAAED